MTQLPVHWLSAVVMVWGLTPDLVLLALPGGQPGVIFLVIRPVMQITLLAPLVRLEFMYRKPQHMAGICWGAMAAALILECAKLLMVLRVSGQGCGQVQILIQ